MGLKNKLSKMKSFLFDEEEEEKEEKKTVRKSLAHRQIKKMYEEKEKEQEKTKEASVLDFEDISGNTPKIDEIKSRTNKTEKEFNFPEFDDDDFMVTKTKPEPIIPVKKEEVKPILYQGSKRKEEIKKFRPSPIISPIYGLLDEEGKVSTEDDKKILNKNANDDVTFDAVRKKAYGKIDEEIENTIKKLSKKTIEEAEKDMEAEELGLKRSKRKIKDNITPEKIPSIISDDEDDDMILPNINFKEIDVDKKTNKKVELKEIDEEDDEDTKEQDLFNLIDTMYSKEEGEE